MKPATTILSAFVFFSTVLLVGAGRAEAQKNDCFVSCGMLSQGCLAGLRSDRSECRLACRGTAPGPDRGECMHACAHVPMEAKQGCKITRDQCRSECDHPNACGFACSAEGRECFTGVRSIAVACRMDCRTDAEADAAACAMAADPEACLAAVAEARGACLDQCGVEQGAALEACGMAFEACKALCRPNDPNEPPDGNEP